ncbi:phosphotransferase [Glycomyces harbinensis]|uniref:Phosphotransferase enzyme family protein n=1 Tax=Glycomyces harbinensis TaxID=58114 RepID=A0A1G6R779_9ACTN|nr:phosphotransferase [Glycomyces harbinensis]SDD00492.1 Phosphotransferase enzyme family protein [Glycomyces harbinensis]
MAERWDASLTALLRERFALRVEAAAPVRGLGDECAIWRTTAPAGYAVRISPVRRSAADLEWVYRVAARFAAVVPEAVAPLRGTDGRAVAVWEGRPVAVWPWIAGDQLDREDRWARRAAAELLARLHAAASAIDPVGPRPDPVRRCAHCRHWSDLRDPALDADLAAWERRTRAVPVALHGDFYRRNLICAGGTIAGLLDWDELRVDYPERELAWAAWELSKNDAGDGLLAARAREFLDVYARGAAGVWDRRMIVPLIREGLRAEVCRNRTGRGPRLGDDPYTAAEVRAFGALRGTAL